MENPMKTLNKNISRRIAFHRKVHLQRIWKPTLWAPTYLVPAVADSTSCVVDIIFLAELATTRWTAGMMMQLRHEIIKTPTYVLRTSQDIEAEKLLDITSNKMNNWQYNLNIWNHHNEETRVHRTDLITTLWSDLFCLLELNKNSNT